MSERHMDVILLNTPQPGIDQRTLSRKLAAAFKKDVAAIDKMLGQPRTRIKKDVDEALANKYKTIIEAAGGQCELVSHAELPVKIDSEEPSPYSPPTAQMEEQPKRYCYKCGAPIQPGTQSCPKCFAPQLHLTTKNKTTAGFLALFFGGLGVHRFYLGQWWGLLYIIFWFSFIPSLVSIVEAVIFFLTPDNRWQEKYGQVPKFGGGIVAAFIVSIFFFVMLIGILAAIALPAYQDYTVRAKVQSAMPVIDDARDQIATFIKKTDNLPNQNSDVGLPEVFSNDVIASMVLHEGAKLEITFNIPALHNTGNTIIWLPTRESDEIVWSCKGGTLADRYRMQECRNGDTAELSSKAESQHSTRLSKRLFSTDQQVSLNVPEGWKEHSSLSEDASISVANVRGASYALVIQESKPDFDEGFTLSEYTQLIVSLMKENIKNGHTPGKLRELKVNGLPAEQLILMGTVENIKVGYVLTTIEGEQGFYQVLAWTLASQLKEQHPLLRNIGKSFVVHQDVGAAVE